MKFISVSVVFITATTGYDKHCSDVAYRTFTLIKKWYDVVWYTINDKTMMHYAPAHVYIVLLCPGDFIIFSSVWWLIVNLAPNFYTTQCLFTVNSSAENTF